MQSPALSGVQPFAGWTSDQLRKTSVEQLLWILWWIYTARECYEAELTPVMRYTVLVEGSSPIRIDEDEWECSDLLNLSSQRLDILTVTSSST